MDNSQNAEWQELEAMVDSFANEMKARLYQKMQEGFSGWNDPTQKSGLIQRAIAHSITLPTFIHEPSMRRRCVDIANRLAMIWTISKAQEEVRNE